MIEKSDSATAHRHEKLAKLEKLEKPEKVETTEKKAPSKLRKRETKSDNTNSSSKVGIGVGRSARPSVEDPILTCANSRSLAAEKPKLDLILRVKTTYRSVAGARQQTLSVERHSEELDAKTFEDATNVTKWGSLSPKTLSAFTKIDLANSNAKTSDEKGPRKGLPLVQRVQWMIVPEFLTEDLWERHQYSISDVQKTLEAFHDRVVWQLARSYNCPTTNAASRVYCETNTELTYGGKSAAIHKLVLELRKRHPEWASRPSITWNMAKADDANGDGRVHDASERHMPGLPVHRLNLLAFRQILQSMHPQNQQNQQLSQNLTTAGTNNNTDNETISCDQERSIFSWRGILIVPLEVNKQRDLLLVGRVIQWPKYVQGFGLPCSIRTKPNTMLAADSKYAIMNETFYFYCPEAVQLSQLPRGMSNTNDTRNDGPTKPARPSKRRHPPIALV